MAHARVFLSESAYGVWFAMRPMPDHSVTLPVLRALGAAANGGPVGLVHIDAHADTGDNYGGSRFHHGVAASALCALGHCCLGPLRSTKNESRFAA